MLNVLCKTCGTQIDVKPAKDKIHKCPRCNNRFVLPKSNKIDMRYYYEATYKFREGKFKDAYDIFDKLAKSSKDAECFFSCLLCKYEVQYEEFQPNEWTLTIGNCFYDSVYKDENYNNAIQNSKFRPHEKLFYESVAEQIEDLRKLIDDISHEVKPYDVFISYKETEQDKSVDQRTFDSDYARQLYRDLEKNNIKAFYAPISLKGKTGKKFLPYIYFAIRSARVLVVIGTNDIYFKSPWIKREWQMYLKFNIRNRARRIIPVYWNCSPDQLPSELQSYQSINMRTNTEWINEIVGICKNDLKLPDSREENFELSLIFDKIKNGQYIEAKEKLEGENGFISRNPKNARGYIALLLIDLQINEFEQLPRYKHSFRDNKNYILALANAGDTPDLKKQLENSLTQVENNEKETKNRNDFNSAVTEYNIAIKNKDESEDTFLQLALKFKDIQYQGSDEYAEKCSNNANLCRKNKIYNSAKKKMELHTAEGYQSAISDFNQIIDYNDSVKKIIICNNEIHSIVEKEKELFLRKQKKMKYLISFLFLVVISLILIILKITDKNKTDVEHTQTTIQSILTDKDKIEDKLKNTADSMEELLSSQLQLEFAEFNIANVGDYIHFGTYEQDGDDSTHQELIEWLVLKKEEDRLLLISKYVLFALKFHDGKQFEDWEDCSLRRILNDSFYYDAFNESERSAIIPGIVDDHGHYFNEPTRVFLLSVDDIQSYFSDESRVCGVTNYAVQKAYRIYGINIKSDNNNCGWWLTSPAINGNGYIEVIDENGAVIPDQYGVCHGVRPCIWVSVKNAGQ